MQFVPYRILRNQPRELRERLQQNGELVVTNNGVPFALMINIEADNFEEIFYLVTQLKAQRAVSELRQSAQNQGLDSLSAAEIEAEITLNSDAASKPSAWKLPGLRLQISGASLANAILTERDEEI